MVMIYKPTMHFPWYYHLAGLISGVSSALAYLTVGKLAEYYESRIIVLAFLLSGVIVPTLSMLVHYTTGLPEDQIFILAWRWPMGTEWLYISLLGFAALFGQYFVTKAYGAEKAGIVSAVSYTNIIFSICIGMLLGDAFPDIMSLVGIICIILGGIIISLVKRGALITNSPLSPCVHGLSVNRPISSTYITTHPKLKISGNPLHPLKPLLVLVSRQRMIMVTASY